MADHLRENSADPNQRKSDCKNLSSLSAAATYKEVVANREMFMETLEHLHLSKGTKFVIPTIGGKALDLHRLFVEVTSRGGLEMVIRDRKWRDVIAVFSFPSTITNASIVLRKYYISLLHDYEQLYFFREKSWPVSVDRSSETASAAVQAQVAKPPLEKENSGNQLTDNVFESHGSTGRNLLQAKKSCPVNFEFMNYTIITSQCKGPLYPPKLCCGALKEFACPYAEELNDVSNDCASTMFSYINLYGKYPPGLFASECREGKLGLACPALAPDSAADANGVQMTQKLSSFLLLGTGVLLYQFL